MNGRPILKTKDKRRGNRYLPPLDIFINTQENSRDCFCNISNGGACFISSNAFNLNDYIFLNFTSEAQSSAKSVTVSVLAKVVWADKRTENRSTYGSQFEFFNDPYSKQQRERVRVLVQNHIH